MLWAFLAYWAFGIWLSFLFRMVQKDGSEERMILVAPFAGVFMMGLGWPLILLALLKRLDKITYKNKVVWQRNKRKI